MAEGIAKAEGKPGEPDSFGATAPGLAFWLILSVWSGSAASSGVATGESYGTGKNPILDVYQHYLSPARGSRCGMHPSCSQYAKLAFARLNPVDAYLATTDRLLRCSQDQDTYPVRYVSGRRMAYDPPPSAQPTADEESLPMAVPALVLAAATPTGSPVTSVASTAIGSPIPPVPIVPPVTPVSPVSPITPISSPAPSMLLSPWLEEMRFPDLALLEYARAYSLAVAPAEKEAGLRGMAVCLRSQGDYRGLARLHRYVSAQETGMEGFNAALYPQEAMLLFESYEYEKSLTTLRLSGIRPDAPGHAEAQLIRCLNLARLEKWGDLPPAAASFTDHPVYGQAARGFQALPQAIAGLPAKSPALAGWMSALIPGSGYAYAGRKGAALAAFVINGLFIWTVAEAVDRKNYAIAATAGVLGSGWYFGGIRGSAASARERNHRDRQAKADAAVQAGADTWHKNDSLRRVP